MKILALPLIVLFLTSGCQQAPTKLYTGHKDSIKTLVKGRKTPLRIDQDTVVIDARKAFDFSMLHIPGSINLGWQEFADHRGPFPGILKDDYDRMAQRLARLGLDRESKVVVVGNGYRGKGEEGRLAWTLFYLGIDDIQVADINVFKKALRQENSKPREPIPFWKPVVHHDVRITRDQFVKGATDARKTGVRIIDVRSQQEYFRRGGGFGYDVPEINAINIDWKEFITKAGRPNYDIGKKLEAIGLKRTDPIFVISNKGIRSGAVTMALLSIGFSNVRNYDGGWKELLKR